MVIMSSCKTILTSTMYNSTVHNKLLFEEVYFVLFISLLRRRDEEQPRCTLIWMWGGSCGAYLRLRYYVSYINKQHNTRTLVVSYLTLYRVSLSKLTLQISLIEMDEYHINYTFINISFGSERCYLIYYGTENQNQFVTFRGIVWTITPTDPLNIFTKLGVFEKKVFIYHSHMT